MSVTYNISYNSARAADPKPKLGPVPDVTIMRRNPHEIGLLAHTRPDAFQMRSRKS